MKTVNYVIKDACGIHARPAGLLVKEAQKCSSGITATCNGKQVSLKKLFAVMGLGAKCGDELQLEITGAEEEKEAAALLSFLEENL